ncbi:GerMN domain-containing protein [Dermatobacter hominis]|uniref:GerMN domain-containing protein n=1 Tax=Dermatobacter hominis TaxID=2884263 RepID=UPI001D0F62EF|nr:GerMN domain-containing protein [Dermatobacter hominis]UDY35950.1 GerMN domain-containing protein [Dermatobacter hominis]
MTRCPTRGVGAALALAACASILAVTSCSIGTDDEPRALAVSTTTTTLPAAPTSGGATAVLYYLREGQLIPVSLSLPDRQVQTVVETLFESPEPGLDALDLTTSVPIDTQLTSLELEDGTLTLDLSEEFDNVVGPSRQQAIAQIVMTATEFGNVERVRFQVDGDPIQVATPTRGDATTVTACDYASLLPDPTDVESVGLGSATLQRLELRTSKLETTCPAVD